MLCDIDLCLGCNDGIDIKCDIVFGIPLKTNNDYINSGNFVNSAMLPPSLMVFIPFLYCGIFFKFHYKEGDQGDEIDQSDEGYVRGDQGD